MYRSSAVLCAATSAVEKRCDILASKRYVNAQRVTVWYKKEKQSQDKESRKTRGSINDQCSASFTCNASSTPRSLGTHMKVTSSGAFRGIARDLVSAMSALSLATSRYERVTCCLELRRGRRHGNRMPRHCVLAVRKCFRGSTAAFTSQMLTISCYRTRRSHGADVEVNFVVYPRDLRYCSCRVTGNVSATRSGAE